MRDELTASLNGHIIMPVVGPVCADALKEIGITPDVQPADPKMVPCPSRSATTSSSRGTKGGGWGLGTREPLRAHICRCGCAIVSCSRHRHDPRDSYLDRVRCGRRRAMDTVLRRIRVHRFDPLPAVRLYSMFGSAGNFTPLRKWRNGRRASLRS